MTYVPGTTGFPSLPVIELAYTTTVPNRLNYAGPIRWKGATAPDIRTDGVTTGGTAQAVQGLDSWTITP